MSARCDLTARQAAYISALVKGMTQAEAAEAVGVRPRTGRRWLEKPAVRFALARAQDDALGEVACRMNAGAGDALDVLREVMADEDMAGGTRVRAAQIWLDTAFRARELLDLTERLREIERILEEQQR